MNQKILVISSSPRRGGNSDTLADAFIRGAVEAGNDVEKVSLREKKIGYCQGCGQCYTKQRPCWQGDDALAIIEQMLNADVIVLVSPVYFYAMSAQLKTLIDRTCGPYVKMHGKHFYFLATAAEGDNDRERLEHVFDNMMSFVDCLEDAEVMGRLLVGGVYEMHAIDGNPGLDAAYEMGKTCR